jgi:hypothetical protein
VRDSCRDICVVFMPELMTSYSVLGLLVCGPLHDDSCSRPLLLYSRLDAGSGDTLKRLLGFALSAMVLLLLGYMHSYHLDTCKPIHVICHLKVLPAYGTAADALKAAS